MKVKANKAARTITLSMPGAEAYLILKLASERSEQEAANATGLHKEALLDNAKNWSDIAASIHAGNFYC